MQNKEQTTLKDRENFRTGSNLPEKDERFWIETREIENQDQTSRMEIREFQNKDSARKSLENFASDSRL